MKPFGRKRVAIAAVTAVSILTAGSVAVISNGSSRSNGPAGRAPSPDWSASASAFPSSLTPQPGATGTGSSRANSAPPARSAPSRLERFSSADGDAMLAAHGALWVQTGRPRPLTCNPCPAVDRLLKITSGGRVAKSIDPATLLAGFRLDQHMVADGSGVWLSGRTDQTIERTRRTSRCRSITRTGPAAPAGVPALIRLNPRTACPDRLIAYDNSRSVWLTEPTPGGPITGLAFEGGWLWVESPIGIHPGLVISGVNPATGETDQVDEIGQEPMLLGAAFGSLWIVRCDVDRSQDPDPCELHRVHTRSGAVVARFPFGHVSGQRPDRDPRAWGMVPSRIVRHGNAVWLVWYDGLMRIDSRTNTAEEVQRGKLSRAASGAIAAAGDVIFVGAYRADNNNDDEQVPLYAIDASSRTQRAGGRGATAGVKYVAVFDGAVWVSTFGEGLWWMDLDAV